MEKRSIKEVGGASMRIGYPGWINGLNRGEGRWRSVAVLGRSCVNWFLSASSREKKVEAGRNVCQKQGSAGDARRNEGDGERRRLTGDKREETADKRRDVFNGRCLRIVW